MARRIAITRAGFPGIGTPIRLKQAGFDDFTIFERVGGTWRDNHYPGAGARLLVAYVEARALGIRDANRRRRLRRPATRFVIINNRARVEVFETECSTRLVSPTGDDPAVHLEERVGAVWARLRSIAKDLEGKGLVARRRPARGLP